VSHANGAKSCIAHALDGGVEPDDFWYEQAAKVLGALTRYGFVVVKSAEAPTVIAGGGMPWGFREDCLAHNHHTVNRRYTV